MQPDKQGVNAVCEYCGHRILFSAPQRQALAEHRRRQEEEFLTQTELYRRKLEEEKKNAPPPSAQDANDEALGRVLLRLFGFSFRIRQLISLLLLIAAAAGAFLLANRLYTAELRTYYLVAGVVTAVVGAFCFWVSYRPYRSIPLGAGLGVLLALLLRTLP